MNDANAPQDPLPETVSWHAPPARAVRLHAITTGLAWAIPGMLSVAIPVYVVDHWDMAIKLAAATLLVLALGVIGWLVGARLRHQRWKLDGEGLWLRQGKLWWKETRVPISRVQHVDLKHGPLERRAALATLVVHTAAIHLSGVTVRGIPEADAEALRDALARQLDDAADAL